MALNRFNHNSFENDVQALSFQTYFDIRHVVAPIHEVLHAKVILKYWQHPCMTFTPLHQPACVNYHSQTSPSDEAIFYNRF
jgi:hypothetical protein